MKTSEEHLAWAKQRALIGVDRGGSSLSRPPILCDRLCNRARRSPLCGGIEKSGNEDRLSSDIASADLSNLPLPDHRHRFETCQCSSGGSEPAEAEPRSDQTLDAPMILLDNIIIWHV